MFRITVLLFLLTGCGFLEGNKELLDKTSASNDSLMLVIDSISSKYESLELQLATIIEYRSNIVDVMIISGARNGRIIENLPIPDIQDIYIGDTIIIESAYTEGGRRTVKHPEFQKKGFQPAWNELLSEDLSLLTEPAVITKFK